MSTKAAMAAFGGVHTAGIYADMTVDGPEIGILVAVFDRAKNLPNRKSIGKQDPYCAARLGKEAKKTETDKRGGQTPRWDQELRFTVHDSPDYHQLKVSVFNDDKKTDLIGETWVPLDKVVVHGGGRNDLWHTLHCKGKYAGEIRIELTYYDTRPKEERPVERRRESAKIGGDDSGKESLSGPRQAKPVKRRPLPAGPTDPSPIRAAVPDPTYSSPLPLTPQHGQLPPGYFHTTPTSQLRYPQNGISQGSTAEGFRPRQRPSQSNIAFTPTPQAHEQGPSETYEYPDRDHVSGASLGRYGHFEDEQGFKGRQSSQPQPFSYGNGASAAMLSSHGDYTGVPEESSQRVAPSVRAHSRSPLPMSEYYPNREDIQPPADHEYNNSYSSTYHASPSVSGNNYGEITMNSGPSHQAYPHETRSMQASVEDDDPSPPPPPVHRSSGHHPPQYEQTTRASYDQVPAPAPLNIRNNRNSASPAPHNVPIPTTYQNEEDYGMTPSPSSGRGSAQPGLPYHQSRYRQPQHRQSQDRSIMLRPRDENYNMPLSLVAGQVPKYDEDDAILMAPDRHSDVALNTGQYPTSLHQYSSSHEDSPRLHSTSRHDAVHSRSTVSRDPFEGHRSSAPMIKPRAVSPEVSRPARKSVSPQPGPRFEDDRRSSVPFSPDSYDVLNPNIASASTVNRPGPQYHTPEQAKEVSRQAKRETQREEGPIIGNDGRIIDPSDHLPTDTWAPEPERKSGKKPSELTARSRPSPQGAQPMPPAGRRPLRDSGVRPHSIATPIFAHSPDSVSPSSGPRNRLQKKSLMGTPQSNSSPAVPTIHSTTHSIPARASMSEYPLREQENYGYDRGSPLYAKSFAAAPPPVPAKVPLYVGQEDHSMSALSEEMKTIDIGVTAGAGRARRSRFRF